MEIELPCNQKKKGTSSHGKSGLTKIKATEWEACNVALQASYLFLGSFS